MGTFHVACRVENHADRARSMRVSNLLEGTESEHTWIPAAKLEKRAANLCSLCFLLFKGIAAELPRKAPRTWVSVYPAAPLRV
jgi:hypothetical protein